MTLQSGPKSYAHASERFWKYENNNSKNGHSSVPGTALINERNPAPGDLAISAEPIKIGASLLPTLAYLRSGGFFLEAKQRRCALLRPATADGVDHGLLHERGDGHRHVVLAAQVGG